MSFFDNLFGQKKPKAPLPIPAQPPPLPPKKAELPTPLQNPEMIKVFDAYGREMLITKDSWRKDVLPATIRSNWNNADQLATVIISALNDGFFAEVLPGAEQLYRIDTTPARGACVYGIVLMKSKRLDDAEKVFRSYLEKHGEDGSILTNLAKIYSERNEPQKSLEILWHALEVDPNLDNDMGWYEVIHREQGGPEAGVEALRRIAELPGSWRAQLWLARHELQNRNLDGALALYRECVAQIKKPAPEDLLMQMSGDLGNREVNRTLG